MNGHQPFLRILFRLMSEARFPLKKKRKKEESGLRQAAPRLFTHYEPQQSRQVEVARLHQPVFHCSLCCQWPLCVSSAQDKFHH